MSSLPELNNSQLDKMNAVPEYLGCYSKDKLPTAKQLNGRYCVVNLQNSRAGPGTHWTLLYDVDPERIVYCDSEGAPPPKAVERLMLRSNKKKIWNSTEIQRLGSSSCGWFATMFAHKLLAGQSLPQIISQYSKSNTSTNESKLRREFHK